MTKENKSNCQKIKDTLRWLFTPIILIYKKFKSLPVSAVGVSAFLAIMLFLTAIFNWFWTGTGIDPTRTFYAPFTNNFKEFQEYATLYIALLAFGATMFAGLAVFLVFNDWKEQHNKKVYSDFSLELLKKYKEVFYLMLTIDKNSLNAKIEMDKIEKRIDLTDNMKTLEKIEIAEKLSKQFSDQLSNILEKVNEVYFEATITSVLLNEPDLILITQKILYDLEEISKEVTDSYIKSDKFSLINFMSKIENNDEKIQNIAINNSQIIIPKLKTKIEA